MTDPARIREQSAERQARARDKRKKREERHECALRRIRDDRATIRTLDDAITAAAVALAPPKKPTQEMT